MVVTRQPEMPAFARSKKLLSTMQIIYENSGSERMIGFTTLTIVYPDEYATIRLWLKFVVVNAKKSGRTSVWFAFRRLSSFPNASSFSQCRRKSFHRHGRGCRLTLWFIPFGAYGCYDLLQKLHDQLDASRSDVIPARIGLDFFPILSQL